MATVKPIRVKKKSKRKKGQPYDKPVSLYPLPFVEALTALAAVRPEKPKPKKKPKKKQTG